MLDVALTIPFWLELAAALTGGLSGAMSAVRARYDIFGVACIAIITGLAGGIMRDILLQNYGIYAFQKPTLIIACAIAGVVVFYFGKLATYLDPIVDLLDNLSVALWAVISVSKSLSAGLDIIPSIILGTITAVGGGILRDICMNREPEAFQAGALYGSAALVGCIVYALMSQNHILDNYAALSCVVLVLRVAILRLAHEAAARLLRRGDPRGIEAGTLGGESRATAQGQGGARQGAARLREAACVLGAHERRVRGRAQQGRQACRIRLASGQIVGRHRRSQRPQRPHHRGPRGAPPHHGRRRRETSRPLRAKKLKPSHRVQRVSKGRGI